MLKPSAKSVWVALTAVELIILLFCVAHYAIGGDEGIGMYIFIYPVAFAFLVLIGTALFAVGGVVFKLASPKQPAIQKRDILHRLLIVFGILAGLAVVIYGLDFLIKQ